LGSRSERWAAAATEAKTLADISSAWNLRAGAIFLLKGVLWGRHPACARLEAAPIESGNMPDAGCKPAHMMLSHDRCLALLIRKHLSVSL